MTIQSWSTTAASNTTVDAVDIDEGMTPADVNNGMRAIMSNVAALRNLIGAAATTGGSSNAYTLTSGLTLTAHQQGILIGFEASFANTDAATINIDSLGAKSLVNQAGNPLKAGQIAAGGIYLCIYEAGADTYKVLGAVEAAIAILSSLTAAANKIPYFSSASAAGLLDFLDEDSFASDSATGVPSQQSTKAYIASQMAGAGLGDMLKSENLSGLANYTTARSNMGLTIGTHVQAASSKLTDIAALAVTDGNIIVGNGTTWVAESGATARTSLGVAIGTNVQAFSSVLAAIAALSVTDGNFIVGNGTTFVAESGATARTSLGLGTSDSPQFTGVNIGNASDTTLTRLAAGSVGVEGVALLRANQNLGDVSSAATSFANIKQAATTSATGVVELATSAETITGTDTARAVTPAGAAAAYQPLDTDLTAVAGLSSTGIVVRTGSGTATVRSVAVTSSTGLAVSNGDGVSGNPTLAGIDASTTVKGVVELATSAETVTGTDTVRAVTPAGAAAAYQPIPTTSTLPVGFCGLMEYISNTALADGDTTAGTNVRSPVAGNEATPSFTDGAGAVQTGTWKNISGTTLDADVVLGNAYGLMVRTA